MFDNIFAAIEKWMRELLTGMVESNMSTMFTDVNEKTSEIAAQVGRTPQNWNSSVFSMIQNLSESVVVPIAGIIITLVLCYELISMLTERNNLHDVDTYTMTPTRLQSRVILAHGMRLMKRRSVARSSSCWSMRNTGMKLPALRSMSRENWWQKICGTALMRAFRMP